jgi:glycosyltransferase involved in cell wall biosynthesis
MRTVEQDMSKIAIISEHASPLALAGGVDSGGQNIYVGQIAEHFARCGHTVDVFTRREDAVLPHEIWWRPGVRVIHVPAGPRVKLPKEDILGYMGDFRRFLGAFFDAEAAAGAGYDVVHANFFMSAMAALPVAQRLGIPFTVTFHALGRVRRQHQGEADRFPDSRFDIEQYVVRHADRIIAECPQDHADLVNLYGADPDRLVIVPCGFDTAEMTPLPQRRARSELGWSPHGFTLLQLGRMVPRKGVEDVIRALAYLRNTHGVDARLCVVGGNTTDASETATPEIGRLRAVAREVDVERYVEFVGRRDRLQLRSYYCAADVFVTTPWYEPFGITPVEAMACARPVVGSDTGGLRYSIVHGETGYLVPPRAPQLLADCLARLAADPALRRRMGEAGLRRARELFTWRRVAAELLTVFDELALQRFETGNAATLLPALGAGAVAAKIIRESSRPPLTREAS